MTHDDKHLCSSPTTITTTSAALASSGASTFASDGTVDFATQKLIHDWKTTRGPDGMKLDAEGRLFVAAGLNKPHPPS